MYREPDALFPALPSRRCGAELDRRRDQARLDAARLRHQAFESFWRGTDTWLDEAAAVAAQASARAGRRLDAALRRHRGERAARP